MIINRKSRVVCWFSCGAASAVAAKLALLKYGTNNVCVCYCDTGSEHESNKIFLDKIENWLDFPITILKSKIYSDIWDVFEKTKWLIGPAGARCTTELKKKLRQDFTEPDDIQVFGYTLEEKARAHRFVVENPELNLDPILITSELDKNSCLALIRKSGIQLPFMYQKQKSGVPYNHNNCIGCVKGGMGYWNKIREDFPEVFTRMAKLERKLDVAILHEMVDGTRIRVFLDQLSPERGNFVEEPSMSCDLMCKLASYKIKQGEQQG